MTEILDRKPLRPDQDAQISEERRIPLFRDHRFLAFSIALEEVLSVRVSALNALNLKNVYLATQNHP